jgi:N-terminal 7TM region of histidine kinase
MSFHFNTFAIVLLMSGVAALLMSLVIFQRTIDAVKWFAAMMFSSAIWAICYAFELSSHTLEQMLFWIDLEYIGIAFIPATWIVFIFKFIGKEEWLTLRNRILIFSFPSIALRAIPIAEYHAGAVVSCAHGLFLFPVGMGNVLVDQ